MNYRGMMDGWHGDEPEIEYEAQCQREKYENARTEDWKYDFSEDNDNE